MTPPLEPIVRPARPRAPILVALLALLALLALVAALTTRGLAPLHAKETPKQPSVAAPDDAPVATTAELLAEIAPLLPDADLVFVGEVVAVHPSPGFWSGVFASFQEVDYRVTRVLSGDGVSPGDDIRVAHPLIGPSRSIAGETVALRPSIVAPGKAVLVVATAREAGPVAADATSHWICAGGNTGMAPASAEIVRATEQALID